MVIWFKRSNAELRLGITFTQRWLSFPLPNKIDRSYIMNETERSSSWVYLYNKINRWHFCLPLPPLVHFINIIHPKNILYQSALCSFSLVTFWLWNFLHKNIGTKGGSKILMNKHHVSVSSTFYVQIFHANIVSEASFFLVTCTLKNNICK